MQTGRARGLAIALAGAIAGTGCAELAPSVPALTIEAVAIERREASGASRWSWGLGAGLSAGLGAAPLHRPEVEPSPAPLPRRAGAPCRVPDLCAWEAQARGRALARMHRALAPEDAR